MDISSQIYEANNRVCSAKGKDAVDILNTELTRFIGDSFEIISSHIIDKAGTKSDKFATVIHTEKGINPEEGIPADAAAVVIDVCEDMDIGSFHTAYKRVVSIKEIEKSPVESTDDRPKTNRTLGIICALGTGVSLEDIAKELEVLNAQTSSKFWPDMIIIPSVGIINYQVQFPSEGLSGDFLPPSEGALNNYTPPIYVVTVLHPAGMYSLNRLLSYIEGHLIFFSPGIKYSNWEKIRNNVPSQLIVLTGYQYNLQGSLLPVPKEYYNDRYFPPHPLQIETQGGEILANITYLPWQDGGTVLLKGKLPLEGLFPFFKDIDLKRAGVIRHSDVQISYVLPITRKDFDSMLVNFQKRSNMLVKNAPSQFILQKISDEGTATPVIGRLSLGILRLRDIIFDKPPEREKFDNLYDFVLSSFMSARESVHEILETWEKHHSQVVSGEIVNLRGSNFHIDESIDKELRKEVENFLNVAARTIKYGMQNLTTELGINISFLFQKATTFNTGIASLASSDASLSNYLEKTRLWSEPLMKTRIALEHGSWSLPKVKYVPVGENIQIMEPVIENMPVTQFVNYTLDRLACFIEDVTAHCLQQRMPELITITELNISERSAENPERFRVTIAESGMPEWNLTYHESPFDEI